MNHNLHTRQEMLNDMNMMGCGGQMMNRNNMMNGMGSMMMQHNMGNNMMQQHPNNMMMGYHNNNMMTGTPTFGGANNHGSSNSDCNMRMNYANRSMNPNNMNSQQNCQNQSMSEQERDRIVSELPSGVRQQILNSSNESLEMKKLVSGKAKRTIVVQFYPYGDFQKMPPNENPQCGIDENFHNADNGLAAGSSTTNNNGNNMLMNTTTGFDGFRMNSSRGGHNNNNNNSNSTLSIRIGGGNNNMMNRDFDREFFHNYDMDYYNYEMQNFNNGRFMNNMNLMNHMFNDQWMQNMNNMNMQNMNNNMNMNMNHAMMQNHQYGPHSMMSNMYNPNFHNMNFHNMRDYMNSSNWNQWNNYNSYFNNTNQNNPNSQYFNPNSQYHGRSHNDMQRTKLLSSRTDSMLLRSSFFLAKEKADFRGISNRINKPYSKDLIYMRDLSMIRGPLIYGAPFLPVPIAFDLICCGFVRCPAVCEDQSNNTMRFENEGERQLFQQLLDNVFDVACNEYHADRIILERVPGSGMWPMDDVIEMIAEYNLDRNVEMTLTSETWNEYEGQKIRDWVGGSEMTKRC